MGLEDAIMRCQIFFLLFPIIFSSCTNIENQVNQTINPVTDQPPTETADDIPSSSATNPSPVLTKTIQLTATLDNWWDYQETIGFNIFDEYDGIYIAGLNGHPTERLPDVKGTLAWSPDGTKILFNQVGLAISDIFLFDMYSGSIIQLTNFGDDKVSRPSWSPDGTQFAIAAGDGIHIFGLDQEEKLHLPSTDYYGVNWSPDGNYLVIVQLNKQQVETNLLLYSLSTESIKPIAETEYPENWPCWSPDSNKIAFIREWNADSSDLFIYDLESGNTIQLTESDADKNRPSWSPDGNQIALEYRSKDLLFDIYIISASGGDPIPLTNFAGIETWPVWSSDGQKIAFEFRQVPAREESEISAGKVSMEPSGIWIFDFESELFSFIDGSQGGSIPAWRP